MNGRGVILCGFSLEKSDRGSAVRIHPYSLQPGLETTDAAFQPLGALPQLSLGRTLPLHIEHAQRVARDRSALPHLE